MVINCSDCRFLFREKYIFIKTITSNVQLTSSNSIVPFSKTISVQNKLRLMLNLYEISTGIEQLISLMLHITTILTNLL